MERLLTDVRLCEDCPPVGYPTDKTRCDECPRKQTENPPGTYWDQFDPMMNPSRRMKP